ncbi:hypothetical protein CPC08DRAFT_711925 [Agrocybe pediades]|nr:hypothetical protein CPC08DRAFT_711925 [Agrocybe pediades]
MLFQRITNVVTLAVITFSTFASANPISEGGPSQSLKRRQTGASAARRAVDSTPSDDAEPAIATVLKQFDMRAQQHKRRQTVPSAARRAIDPTYEVAQAEITPVSMELDMHTPARRAPTAAATPTPILKQFSTRQPHDKRQGGLPSAAARRRAMKPVAVAAPEISTPATPAVAPGISQATTAVPVPTQIEEPFAKPPTDKVSNTNVNSNIPAVSGSDSIDSSRTVPVQGSGTVDPSEDLDAVTSDEDI